MGTAAASGSRVIFKHHFERRLYDGKLVAACVQVVEVEGLFTVSWYQVSGSNEETETWYIGQDGNRCIGEFWARLKEKADEGYLPVYEKTENLPLS